MLFEIMAGVESQAPPLDDRAEDGAGGRRRWPGAVAIEGDGDSGRVAAVRLVIANGICDERVEGAGEARGRDRVVLPRNE